MEEKILTLVKKENEIKINKKSYGNFFFEYQKSVLLNLSDHGAINNIQCQICIEKLLNHFRQKSADS